MLFTSQSVLLALSALCAVRAQPHGHIHQHGASKRATGAVKGRGIVYADGNTGMGALAGKLDFSTNWTPWQDNPANDNLGTFVRQVWGIDYANGDPMKQYQSAFLKAAATFPEGETYYGYNEPEQIGQSWLSPQEAVNNWGAINDLKNSKGAKICTPCPSNGNQQGTSGTGSVTLQAQTGINQGSLWMSEFLDLASGQYTFDCLCTHWYGGPANTVDQDQAMIESQIKDMAALASKHGIPDVVIGEMQRVNGDGECQFVKWFEETFLTDAQYADSGNKVTAYAYNFNKFTLTNGNALTAVGSAFIGEGGC